MNNIPAGDYLIPKELMNSEKYKELDSSAILLYSILLDEISLVSTKTGAYDDEGNLYVSIQNKRMCDLLNIHESKLIKIKKQLVEYDLINIEKAGVGIPNRIFPKKPTQ